MVMSAADGGPQDGQTDGLPIDRAIWQEHVAGFGEDAAAVAGDGADQVLGTSFSQTDRLALGDEERLPWLESADDVDLDGSVTGNSRLIGFGIFALLLLAVLVGGLYWLSHRGAAPAAADGSLIAANKEPYKVAPQDPGGKTFEGTGDASFKVSEGEKPAANLAGSAAPVAPAVKPPAPTAPSADGGAATPAAPAGPTSGVGVQIGAFSTNSAAQAAWDKLATAHAPLKGLSHRVIEGKADMATVFRLQAVADDLGGANALCAKLQAGGLKCQVKR